jgi:hypothetical protein
MAQIRSASFWALSGEHAATASETKAKKPTASFDKYLPQLLINSKAIS